MDDIRSHVLYAFIDAQTTSRYYGYETMLDPDLELMRKAINNLLRLALKRFFDAEPSNDCSVIRDPNGYGEWCGLYFSSSVCLRAVCVAVSTSPVGVDILTPIPVSVANFCIHNFCKNEIAEYLEHAQDEYALFRLMGKKQAFRRKHMLVFADKNDCDCTLQDVYSLHKDSFDGREYLLAATDTADFTAVDIRYVLP